MRITNSERNKVVRSTKPGQTKTVDWGNGITEDWTASEVYLDDGGFAFSVSFHSGWGRHFKVSTPNHGPY